MDLVQSLLHGETKISREEIGQLTGMVRDLYRSKDNVVEIPSRNVFFIGDLHGEFESVSSVRRLFHDYANHSFVFLGDYADRGPSQIETFNLVIAMALANPERVIMLRGNHESDEVAQRYGFYYEVMKKYSQGVYNDYLNVFQVLPLAAISDQGVFACHGGIPERVRSLQDIQVPDRFDIDFPDDTLFQLVWNDPKEADFRFAANSRGARVRSFGRIAFDDFSSNLGVNLFFRAHEVFSEGIMTFFDTRLYSIFSASYHGQAMPKIARLGGEFNVEIIPL